MARTLDPLRTLAELADRWPGAADVFRRHGLDFCCHGTTPLCQACADRGLDVDVVVDELRTAHHEVGAGDLSVPAWDQRPLSDLLDHLLGRYHAGHRAQLPRLQQMAATIERVHGHRDDYPHGLAQHLRHTAVELEIHMQKEESILFPMLRSGHGSHARGPIQVMEQEHLDHGANLTALRRLAHGFVPPAAACATWRSLYRELEQFEGELMRHIHLENHVLFPRVLNQ